MLVDIAGRTHVGGRSHNEDAFCVDRSLGLLAVADGMGGYEGGEVASALAIDALREALVAAQRTRAHAPAPDPARDAPCPAPKEAALSAAVLAAHEAIAARKQGRLAHMGSTVAALWLDRGAGDATLAHVGDSRVYRYRAGALEQLTRDHSLVEELRAQGLERHDTFAHVARQYANVITRALGMQGELRVSTAPARPLAGDVFLLCSDGLSGPLGDEGIAQVLALRGDADRLAARLVEAAVRARGGDNITAVVLRVLS